MANNFTCATCGNVRDLIFKDMIQPIMHHRSFGPDYCTIACMLCNVEGYVRHLILHDRRSEAYVKHQLFTSISKWADRRHAGLEQRELVLTTMRDEADEMWHELYARYPTLTAWKGSGTWYVRETAGLGMSMPVPSALRQISSLKGRGERWEPYPRTVESEEAEEKGMGKVEDGLTIGGVTRQETEDEKVVVEVANEQTMDDVVGKLEIKAGRNAQVELEDEKNVEATSNQAERTKKAWWTTVMEPTEKVAD